MGQEPDSRLPGEPATPSDLDDVELWIEVYTELTTALRRVAAESANHEALMRRLTAIDGRRRYWLERRSQALRGEDKPTQSAGS